MTNRPALAALLLLACTSGSAQSTGPLAHEAIVHAPLERLWEAWTTTPGLAAWLAPHVEIDLRIGGTMRTNYGVDGTLGDAGTIENTILSYDPYKMLSFRVTQAPADFPFPKAIYEMWTVLYFDALSPSETRVRVVSNGFSADEESQKMRAFFAQGNAATLRQLQERVGSNLR